MKVILLYLLLVFGGTWVNAQELSFTHYDRRDGLAGSIAYSMVQDKDGFLWIGTETGLSRFDGTNFVNFTTLDGLPDNEILSLFADSKGRVWIMCFKIGISYYYKGKIHTQQNDSVLKSIKLTSNAYNIAEDNEGNIYVQEDGEFLHVISNETKVDIYETPDTADFFVSVSKAPEGGVWLRCKSGLYSFKSGVFKKYLSTKKYYPHTLVNSIYNDLFLATDSTLRILVTSISKNRGVDSLSFPRNHNRISLINDSIYFVGRNDGISVVQLRKSGGSEIKKFLDGTSILSFIIDNENNWWFGSEGKGLFRLNSPAVRTFSFIDEQKIKIGIYSLDISGRRMVLGGDRGNLVFTEFQGNLIQSTKVIKETVHRAVGLKIGFVNFLPDGRIVYGQGVGLNIVGSKGMRNVITAHSIKSIDLESDSTILVGTNSRIMRFDYRRSTVVDTIWTGRSTCLTYSNGQILIGTLNGLYKMDLPGKILQNLGEQIPILKNRVASIKIANDNTVWVALYGMGMVALRKDTVYKHFTTKDGLVSNVCKVVFTSGSNVWVGTDRGLSKIRAGRSDYTIVNYSSNDGLSSETINAIFVKDSTVFVATPEGLTYFNENEIEQESVCLLRMNRILVNNNFFSTDSTSFSLYPNLNNVRFEFVGISYKSAGDINYKHRLVGLDSVWQTTKAGFLSFPSLPFGEYTLQVQAINKFGKLSELKVIKFRIEKPLTQETWFRISLVSLLLASVVAVFLIVIKRIKDRDKERREVTARLQELEQLALKSQMNPHFIFNSLNSIQHYVMEKDIAGANRFISDFSKLIRLTLDYSSRSTIPVVDEVNYLKTYLEIEKSRLENQFDFEIFLSDEIAKGDYVVPPMLIQPYIENSLRHGIRFLQGKRGKISLSIRKTPGYLEFIVEDNGIGRKAASLTKAAAPIEYQSKGMSLTKDRVDFLNRSLTEKVSVLIEDLVDTDLVGVGTRVSLSIPENLS